MYTLNSRLAADIFDNEYIIANLDTGLYYSIQGLAVSLVSALPFEDPKKPISLLAAAFPEINTTIESELKATWEQLFEEGIIKQSTSSTLTANIAWIPATQYAPSRFNRYADMQDILMLDPIHDVDEEGWSVKNDEQKA
jgi:hypothetical protein